MRIIPTILALNKKDFLGDFEKLVGISKNIQVDFMDGRFVSSKSVLVSQIPDLKKYGNNFEAHLMVKNPIALIGALKRKGFSKVIFHFESYTNGKMIDKTIDLIKTNGMKVWLAVNPETSVDDVVSYCGRVDGILFLGVHPGKSGQKFIDSVFGNVKKLRAMKKQVKIQVDGGVDLVVARHLALAGANYLNSGSFVSRAENPREALRKLEGVFRKEDQ